MTMITPSYLGETIEYSSLHACRSTLEDPTKVWFSSTDIPDVLQDLYRFGYDIPALSPGDVVSGVARLDTRPIILEAVS